MPSNEPSAVPRSIGATMRLKSSRVGISPCDLRGHQPSASISFCEVGDDLAEPEHAHRDDDEVDAVGQFRQLEREARDAGVDVGADDPEQQAEHDHADRVQQRAAGQHDRRDQAQHHQREVFGRPELQRDFRSGGAASAIRKVHDRAGEERADRGGGERDAGAARCAPSGSRRAR